MSRKRPENLHLIDECFMRPSTGLPCWSRCECGEYSEAATPDLLVEATRAHRKAAGLPSTGMQRSGDKWDGSWAVGW